MVQQQKKEQPENETKNIRVAIDLQFLESLNNLLLRANSRISWEPQELIPAGMILRDLNEIINYYKQNKQTQDKDQ